MNYFQTIDKPKNYNAQRQMELRQKNRKGGSVYFENAPTYSTTPVLELRRVFLTWRSCFFDMALSLEGSLLMLSCFTDRCACLNSFSALRFSFSNRRSFLVIFACLLSSRNSCCSSIVSFRANFSCSRCSHVFVWPLNEVFINNDALFCGLVFQERPETLRPFTTVFVSDFVAASDIANLMVLPDGSGGDEIVAEMASSGGARGMLVSTTKLCFHGGNKKTT
jgi:hypothetical protein